MLLINAALCTSNTEPMKYRDPRINVCRKQRLNATTFYQRTSSRSTQ